MKRPNLNLIRDRYEQCSDIWNLCDRVEELEAAVRDAREILNLRYHVEDKKYGWNDDAYEWLEKSEKLVGEEE